MIRSFAGPRVERFFRDGICPARWQAFETIAKRKLDMLDAATKLSDLRNLDRPKAFSYLEQFRVCYRWSDQGPTDVEVVV
jgi:proteic killer suppression protein